MVKRLPTVQENWVHSLGWEDPLEWAWQPTPVFFLENPTDRGAWHATVHGVEESDMAEHASMQTERKISPFPMQRLPEFFGAVSNL